MGEPGRGRVAYGLVRYEVMDVVATLPPANGQATAEVCNEHADQSVGNEIMGDASMTCIVGSEHDLMLCSGISNQPCTLGGRRPRWKSICTYPEETEETSRCHVPLGPQTYYEQGENRDITDEFFSVFGVTTVVESFVFDSLM